MSRNLFARMLAGTCAVALAGAVTVAVRAQGQAPAAPGAGAAGGRGAGGGAAAGNNTNTMIWTALDTDKDGSVTKAEMKSAFDKWYDSADTAKAGSVTQQQLAPALNTALGYQAPAPAADAGAAAAGRGAGGGAGAGGGRGRAAGPFVAGATTPGLNDPCGGRSQTPTMACQKDIDAMMAAIPATAPAKPVKAHKVLIWSRIPSSGFQHSSIPLAAKAVEEIGKKTGGWTSNVLGSRGVHHGQPEAVRRHLPLEHDGLLPRHGAGHR